MVDGFKYLYSKLGIITDWNEKAADGELYKYGTFEKFDQTEFVGVNSTKENGEPWTFEET